MASGYVFLDAIRNGIYMKALTDQESIAMCILDLAMGFNRKFPNNDGTFILKCCELALAHFPAYISAVSLKAETLKRQVEQLMKLHNKTNPKSLFPVVKDSELL